MGDTTVYGPETFVINEYTLVEVEYMMCGCKPDIKAPD
jgi:hypothetical protein